MKFERLDGSQLHMKRIVVGISLCAGCVATTPPPIVPRHASPAAPEQGTVSLSFVTGLGYADLFNAGWGGELRASYQASNDAEIGVGLGIGRSSADVEPRTQAEADAPLRTITMLSLRAYSTLTPFAADHVALTNGVGILGLAGTGLVALTLDTAATIGYANDVLVPYASVVGALSIPIRDGRAFGSEKRYSHPRTAAYVGGLVGLGLPLGTHLVSLEGGYLDDLRSTTRILGVSLADRWSR